MPTSEAALPLSDPAVQAGLGIFETMAVRSGRVLDLSAHLARLRAAAVVISVDLPPDADLAGALVPVVASLAKVAWVKILASRSGLLAVFGAGMDPAEESAPSSAILLDWRRSHLGPIAGIKTLNYAPFILGTEQARAQGADEGIWLNTRGHVGEGCSSNLVVVQGGKLFTASPGDGVLPGIVRDLALSAARDLRLPVHEGKVRLKRLEQADEAFLTSSLRSIRPLVRFRHRPVGTGQPGPITARISGKVGEMRTYTDPARWEPGPEG
jgi:branched-subunit amino acid aminotransferase/4-amino-4-deoxychorismate lyase